MLLRIEGNVFRFYSENVSKRAETTGDTVRARSSSIFFITFFFDIRRSQILR